MKLDYINERTLYLESLRDYLGHDQYDRLFNIEQTRNNIEMVKNLLIAKEIPANNKSWINNIENFMWKN